MYIIFGNEINVKVLFTLNLLKEVKTIGCVGLVLLCLILIRLLLVESIKKNGMIDMRFKHVLYEDTN